MSTQTRYKLLFTL